MANYQFVYFMDGVSKTYPGGKKVFENIRLNFLPGVKIGVVGVNGAGKSTLLKIMAGMDKDFSGEAWAAEGARVGYLPQEPHLEESLNVRENVMLGVASKKAILDRYNELAMNYSDETADEMARLQDEIASQNLWDLDSQIDVAMEALRCPPDDADVTVLSGGERRRAALAKLMAEAPELMLLDEPTNHLDIEAVQWLENELKSTKAAYVLISHDRAFLRALTRATLWIDRGEVRRQETGFDGFEAWRDKVWDEEEIAKHKMDRKIKAEARWAVEGISARRKRNQGRVRALQDLRAERASMIKRQGTAALTLESGPTSGKKVIEVEGLTKSFGDKQIVKGLTITIQRGDRVAFVGPNGVGKTSVIKMMLGQVDPDAGRVKLGTNLEVAVFDQTRAQLDPEMSLWDSLTGDPEMRVGGRADQVMVRGVPKHVVAYLKDFLFSEAQARAPVKSLSGGEKARLLLAKLMAKPSNLLVLDEPTNDLDIETLDLLQEILDDYDGTVILVSHDRDFLDRVATTTIAMEGNGNATVYAGGWTDYLAQRGTVVQETAKPAETAKPVEKPKSDTRKNGLSFTEKHRLEELPSVIDKITAEIAKLEELMADPELFTKQPVKFQKATEALVQRQDALAAAEEEWMLLMEKSEA